MQRHLGLLLTLLLLACVADAFTFHAAGRGSLLRVASRPETMRALDRRPLSRRMATPTMMAAGGAKKKVLVLGGDG